MTTRTVISKSAKRKMTSFVEFPIEVDGKMQMKKVIRKKANDFTEQVVYRTKLANGKFTSVTKHERVGG
jgi:hypothetical protein